jgi:PIN domain nuclease of toxin-antitoxin system
MKVLLDTHAFLWLITEEMKIMSRDSRLSNYTIEVIW